MSPVTHHHHHHNPSLATPPLSRPTTDVVFFLFSNILTTVNDTDTLERDVRRIPQPNVPVALAVLCRQTLVGLRLVSSGWRDAGM